MPNIAVIGGGAAGLCAAVTIKQHSEKIDVTVFERLDRVGKKIAVTGNGRCNISNKDLSLSHYHGSDVNFAKHALKNFDLKKTEDFFKNLGVIFKEGNNGKLYPYSLQASSVSDALRFCADRLGVKTVLQEEITEIKPLKGGFLLNNTHRFNAVIIATGGIAGGKIANENAYKLLSAQKHTRTALLPAIVQLKTDNSITKSLKGVKVDATVKIGNETDFGEVLFCDYGLSGPPIMQLSRYAKTGKEVHLDLMPETDFAKLSQLLFARTQNLDGTLYKDFFCGMLHNRLGQVIVKSVGKNINDTVRPDRNFAQKCADIIKDFAFTVTGNTGFANAQVTNGGIKTDEFFADTLMSRRCHGLFAAGEVLDIDGDCGGYNLQWAWSSGYTAGLGALKWLGGIK